jgi:transcriptional regulator with XRE-family HTH domain
MDLGEHTGLSATPLSKLERGKLFPTLPTLLRIATPLGVGLECCFADERKRRVVGIVRREERLHFPGRPVAQDVQYYFSAWITGRRIESWVPFWQIFKMSRRRNSSPTTMESNSSILKGSLTIKIAAEEFLLESEDAIYFDSAVAHSYHKSAPNHVPE